MNATTFNQQRIDAAFAQIAEILTKEEHNDASLFRAIAQVAAVNPDLAVVLSSNIAYVLESKDAEVDYSAVLVEAYKASLFEARPGFAYYGYIGDDPEKAEHLAMQLGAFERTGSTQIHAATSLYTI